MLPIERRRNIIERISEKKGVKVIELSQAYGVTEETIRRDLYKLEKEGILLRTYGGAVAIKKESKKQLRKTESEKSLENKRVIAEKISDLIEDNDVLMLGAGTTSLEIIKKINDFKNITVITNSMLLLAEMAHNNNIKMICAGGTLCKNSRAFIGPTAIKTIHSYHADKVILSCKGIDIKKGIMESNEMQADVKVAMLQRAKTVILAADHTKFNCLSMVMLFDFSVVDIIVTDIKPPKEWMKYFAKMGVKCIF